MGGKGLVPHAVYEDGKGGIIHAELVLGSGMIMLSSKKDGEFSHLQSTPAALGGTTQSPYLIVSDAGKSTAVPRRRERKIVIAIRTSCNRRGFSCRRNHLWNIGTYNPGRRFPEGKWPRNRRLLIPRSRKRWILPVAVLGSKRIIDCTDIDRREAICRADGFPA
jgi:hypothetical protein